MIFFIVLFILLLLFIVLLFSTVHVSFLYSHQGDDDFLRLKVSVWKFISYSFAVPEVKVNTSEKKIEVKEKSKGTTGAKRKKTKITVQTIKENYKKYSRLLVQVTGFYRILRRFLKKVKISEVRWDSRFGLGDAASTAVASGAIWALKGNVLGILSHFVSLKGVPSIQVIPVYQGTLTQTRLSCMISFKIGHAIVVMLQMLKHWRKISSSKNKKSKKYIAGGTSHV
ncbi:DUF2953 domain-containing protein [Fictibacillus terranigra]|uniref:DUF2953 domain-containing protein n=1 Tax=Fictibacillus terranigra TaxID=3058424 RepID=A0ABT8E3W8_9BACL|nr:DUF2953 domain-containing protein [Fictibacillus sp. CENA-BCM004]MDN4072597.1 DUF2953 domain-containing protein [Fictibacillus sp. CENA-BCM004]